MAIFQGETIYGHIRRHIITISTFIAIICSTYYGHIMAKYKTALAASKGETLRYDDKTIIWLGQWLSVFSFTNQHAVEMDIFPTRRISTIPGCASFPHFETWRFSRIVWKACYKDNEYCVNSGYWDFLNSWKFMRPPACPKRSALYFGAS